MELDPEINAMSKTLEILKDLDKNQKKRIVKWISEKFELNKINKLKPGEKKQTEKITQPVDKPAIIEIKQTMPKPTAARESKITAKPVKEKDLKQYDTVLDIFLESNVKKVTDKILLMTAYLQEKLNFKEVSSLDINSQLKRTKYGVPNITSTINEILKKKPPLLVVTEEKGENKQGRRKFRLTDKGLKVVKNFF